MATIISWFPRVALKDFQIEVINGFHMKKGWVVNKDARAIHFNPNLYDEPLKFRPSRFDGEDLLRNELGKKYDVDILASTSYNLQVFGGNRYKRSAEDIAFVVALFIAAKHGSFVNYYMFWYRIDWFVDLHSYAW